MYTINLKRSEFALLINALNELQPDQPDNITSIDNLIANLSEQVGAQIQASQQLAGANPMHFDYVSFGRIILINDERYILAKVGWPDGYEPPEVSTHNAQVEAALIGLKDGNRWTEPAQVTVHDRGNCVTFEDFRKTLGHVTASLDTVVDEATGVSLINERRAGGLADRELIYSAEIPKQPITRPFNITLRQKEDRHGVTWSTHQEYRDEQGGADHGHYDMGLSEAVQDYAIRVTQAMRYANVQGGE